MMNLSRFLIDKDSIIYYICLYLAKKICVTYWMGFEMMRQVLRPGSILGSVEVLRRQKTLPEDSNL
jgi:hypothetical protein